MSMTPRPWSISALATEFGLDRRTVAARIKNIPPSGERAGHAVWKLADVAPVLSSPQSRMIGSTERPPPPPPGCTALAKVEDPVHALAAVPMMLMAYRIPALAAVIAVEAGASCRTAYGLYAAMQLVVATQCQSIGKSCGFEPWLSNSEFNVLETDEFDEANWQVLATKSGETIDFDDWLNYASEQFKEAVDKR